MIDHREARELYENAVEADRVNRDEAVEDLKFRAGEQWPDDERQNRLADKRPCLTINRTGQFVRRITGAARQNPPSIKVIPTDAESQEDTREMAEVREGLIRHIEHRSRGRWVYINALDNAATCGIGHIRILTEYDERDPFTQEIRLATIQDPLAVVYDPDARRLTKEDGMFCMVTGLMTPRAFEKKYPKASRDDWERGESADASRYWEMGENIRVVEMFRRVPETRKLVLMSDGARVDVTDDDEDYVREVMARAAERGIEPVAEREYERHKVMRSVMSGREYLEDEVEFPSRYLPIIPVMGEEIYIGEEKVRQGVVRPMRDPQRLYNYWRTSAAEMVALAPKAPFMATPSQIGPFKSMWDQANRKPLPYLLYNADEDAPNAMPTRATAPEPPSSMWQEAGVAEDDMKGVTGIYDASLGAQGNETSGRAILARQQEGDIGTFLYIDNLRHAVERVGVTILDMLPRVYDSERTIQVMEENGDTKPYRINETMPDGTERNALSTGAFEVRVSTGPSYRSKQEETAQMMIELIRSMPSIANVAGDILVKSLDFPGSDEVAERLEQAIQGPQEPDPMQQQAAQIELRKLLSEAMKNEAAAAKGMADAQKTSAETGHTSAETQQTAAETEGQALDNLAKLIAIRMGQVGNA